MNAEKLDELIRHNGNLVRTAQTLQQQVQAAVRTCGQVVDSAEPVSHFDAAGKQIDSVEYYVPAEEIEELRAMCILARTWGMVDL